MRSSVKVLTVVVPLAVIAATWTPLSCPCAAAGGEGRLLYRVLLLVCYSEPGDGTHHATSYTLADHCLATVATPIGQSFSQHRAITGRAEWFSGGNGIRRQEQKNCFKRSVPTMVEDSGGGASGDCKRYEGVTRSKWVAWEGSA